MTRWEGRAGFGEAPTSAIVRASRRISAGLRLTAQGYPPGVSDLLRVACVQMTARAAKADSLALAETLVARAAGLGAEVVLLPERWTGFGQPEAVLAAREPLEGGESVEAMRAWARRHGITIVGGSISEQVEGRERGSNTCVVVDPEGEIAAVYRKIHMYDVELPGVVSRESELDEPGDAVVACEVDGWTIGLSICYDLRFPELYRALAAEAVTVPAAFALLTGKDHWEPLLRARAIENQCYVLAANQWGPSDPPGWTSCGRSLIVDPWGVVVAQAPDGNGVAAAELDRAHLERIRTRLPALAHRRPAEV